MNESFDQELTRAFKESTAKSLQGWEFTPAMRSRVLERIRQEETAAPAPTEPPVTGFRPQRIIRPLSWVAVAAAAVLVVFNLGPSIGSKKSEAPQLTMSSAPAQEPGMRSAMKSAPGAPETESAAQQADAASGEGAASTAEATVTAIPPAENVRLAPMNVTVVALTAPASDVGPRTGAPEGPGEGKMSVAAAGSVLNLAISAPADGPVVTLTAEGVKVLSSDDTVLWEQSVANLDPASSVLAAAPDGLVAVGNGGNELHLFGAGGTTDQTVLATANIERLAWSADGRVASAEGAMTVVYNGRNGRQEFSVEAGSEADLAWAPDGVLATLGTEKDAGRRLVLTDLQGKEVLRSPTRGRGIAFLHGGGVVVAGNTAFDRSGGNLWPVPLEPAGLAAAGDDALVAWDGHQVVLQEARSGQLLLRADLNVPGASITRVVPSPDGRLLAVVGSNPDGDSVVWVMDRSGRILWTERFRETPTGMAFAGDQLVIMLPHKVKFRTIPQ